MRQTEVDYQKLAKRQIEFDVEQLEQWKDQVAEWWGREAERYDAKRTVQVFQQWFGINKREAVDLEYSSREDSARFVERFLNHVIYEFRKKLETDLIVSRMDVELGFKDGAVATVEHGRETFHHDLPGHCGITGTVYYTNGGHQAIFQKFVSHPFWQYSNRYTDDE